MFGKVYSQIFDGTLHGKLEATAVFMAMIAVADVDGCVDKTIQSLTAVTGWPAEFIQRGVSELEAVDIRSRTPDMEGRRIVRLRDHTDWGWRIVNYKKYRDIRDDNSRRAYQKEWVAQKRAQSKVSTPVDNVDSCLAMSTNAEVDVLREEAVPPKKEVRPRKRETVKISIPPDFVLTEAMREQALRRYQDCDVDEMFVQFRAHHEAHGKPMKSWTAAWTTWVGRAAQFGYPKRRATGRKWD